MHGLTTKCKSFIKILSIIITALAVITLLYVGIYLAIDAIDAAIARKEIEKCYHPTDKNYVFVDREDREVPDFVADVINKLPEEIAEMIKEEWYIVIADKDPLRSTDSRYIAGAAHARGKIIWLTPDCSEHTLAHEIGHALAFTENHDMSSEFCALHARSLDTFLEFKDEKFEAYDTTTPTEFFAYLFDQYICEPERLENNLNEGYRYISTLATNYKKTFVGTLFGPITKFYNTVAYKTKGLFVIGRTSFSTANIENEVKDQPLIDVSKYSSVESFAGLNETERDMVRRILDVIENSDNYETKTYFKRSAIVIKCDYYVTYEAYNKIAACVDFYYGQETSDVFDVSSDKKENRSTLYIFTDTAARLKQERQVYIEKIEGVISTLHEGTETQKLLQISKYIAENCEYEIKDKTSVNDFFESKTGDCVTYAMVFRMFCERLGIQCDIVCGITSMGDGHAWNRVLLSDGTYRYYDLTYYSRGTLDMPGYDDFIVLAFNGYFAN